MSLHAAAAGTSEHAQSYAASNPYAHPFTQQPQLNFYPPTSGSPHLLGQPPYVGSHLYGNTGNHHSNLPQNLSGNHKDQIKKEPKIPQQQVQMSPTQEYDGYSDKYVGNQSASLKETQKSLSSLSPTSQDHFSHHFKKEHLNSKPSQYLTQENFDAHRKSHLDQPRLTEGTQDQSTVENLTKPSTEQPGKEASVSSDQPNQMSHEKNKNFASHNDRQNELEQISPVPSSASQQSDHAFPRKHLEEPMVDGEKVSPIASDRTNPVGLRVEPIPEPPFGALSPTTPISNPKQSENVSPSPTNQRPMEVTSTPIPPSRDAGFTEPVGQPEPSALDKLKSLANRTDDLVMRTTKPDHGQGHGQGQEYPRDAEKKTSESSEQKNLDRHQSYQSSEYSSDSEDRSVWNISHWILSLSTVNISQMNSSSILLLPFPSLFRYDERAGSYEDIRRSISSEENLQMARERNPGFPFPPFALGGLGGLHTFLCPIESVFPCKNTFQWWIQDSQTARVNGCANLLFDQISP